MGQVGDQKHRNRESVVRRQRGIAGETSIRVASDHLSFITIASASPSTMIEE
jgi:hypothetical protein